MSDQQRKKPREQTKSLKPQKLNTSNKLINILKYYKIFTKCIPTKCLRSASRYLLYVICMLVDRYLGSYAIYLFGFLFLIHIRLL